MVNIGFSVCVYVWNMKAGIVPLRRVQCEDRGFEELLTGPERHSPQRLLVLVLVLVLVLGAAGRFSLSPTPSFHNRQRIFSHMFGCKVGWR